MKSVINVVFDENKDDSFSIKKKGKYKYPSFTMFSNGYNSKYYRRKSMDASTYLEDLNPKCDAMKTWKYLKNNRDIRDNIVFIKLTSEEKKIYFYKGIKQLVKDGIVKKIQNGIYMLNPFFIVATEMDDSLCNKWDELK